MTVLDRRLRCVRFASPYGCPQLLLLLRSATLGVVKARRGHPSAARHALHPAQGGLDKEEGCGSKAAPDDAWRHGDRGDRLCGLRRGANAGIEWAGERRLPRGRLQRPTLMPGTWYVDCRDAASLGTWTFVALRPVEPVKAKLRHDRTRQRQALLGEKEGGAINDHTASTQPHNPSLQRNRQSSVGTRRCGGFEKRTNCPIFSLAIPDHA